MHPTLSPLPPHGRRTTGLRLPSARALLPELAQARAASAVFVVGLAGVVVYFFLPATPRDVLFVAFGGVAALLIAGGAFWNFEGRNRIPWYLLAVSQLAFSIGDLLFNFYPQLLGRELPFPSTADIVYLAGYPFLGLGIYLLVRQLRSAEGNFVYLDAALITGAFALVQWVFLISPYVDRTDESVFARIVLMAYPAVDVLLLGVLARFFVVPSWRAPAYTLLMGSVVLLIAADEFYRNRSGGLQGPGSGRRICGVWSGLRLRRSLMVIARPRSCS